MNQQLSDFINWFGEYLEKYKFVHFYPEDESFFIYAYSILRFIDQEQYCISNVNDSITNTKKLLERYNFDNLYFIYLKKDSNDKIEAAIFDYIPEKQGWINYSVFDFRKNKILIYHINCPADQIEKVEVYNVFENLIETENNQNG